MTDEECFDVLTKEGIRTGISKPRSLVHKDGDYHKAVHVWIFAERTGELLLQKRADCKDSWPGLWDISSAGHISAGDTSLITARRELEEELGLVFPSDAFEMLFVFLEECITNDGTFINNEYDDVYLVTILDPIPLEAFMLQDSEVSMVKYMHWKEYEEVLRANDSGYVSYDVDGTYGYLFSTIKKRYYPNPKSNMLALQNKLARYAPVILSGKVDVLSKGDASALPYIIKAAQVMDQIFLQQKLATNRDLMLWLENQKDRSELDNLKFSYYSINGSPWSVLDENEAYLTTADSAIKKSKVSVQIPTLDAEYRAAFPLEKHPGANFYPADMDKEEFFLWLSTMTAQQEKEATDFFTVIRRCSDGDYKYSENIHGLQIVKYAQEYQEYLSKASELLNKAAELASTPSLKRYLKARADAFISNDYYESDIAWIELDSALDVTIGPYETYEDALFGFKATFEAFIGIRDEVATAQLKIFMEHLQELENCLPLGPEHKSTNVTASPIRVVQLIYNAGDVKGPQTMAFNLPNDERVIKEHGCAMVMMKNVSQAKFEHILLPISKLCITASQWEEVEFEPFFAHTICHECCHGLGPHTITSSNGQSTVRKELQEVHSALEEAKADIVGLWALHYLVDKGVLPRNIERSMYISFLAGCFRSVRFGLKEAHGKGQALQFNWILKHGGFVCCSDGTFSVDFNKIRAAVEGLSSEILKIQAEGNKVAAKNLLDMYATITPELGRVLSRLEEAKVPVDIAPSFPCIFEVL